MLKGGGSLQEALCQDTPGPVHPGGSLWLPCPRPHRDQELQGSLKKKQQDWKNRVEVSAAAPGNVAGVGLQASPSKIAARKK